MKKIIVKNDQFYTKLKTAKKCINKLFSLFPDNYFDTIIEPSAGTGSFSSQIKNCLAYDLDPKEKNIKQQDFLLLKYNKTWKEKILFIGNPPFGKRSSLAKKFIRHAIEINASTIGFILPNIFKKSINQKYNLFPKEWKLIDIIELDNNAFYIKDNEKIEDYHVPCSFFIWSKEKIFLNKKDRRICTKFPQPKEFSFLNRGDSSADFVINGNSGKIKELSAVTNSKSEHYIKINTEIINIFKARKIFQNLKYEKNSSVNGGNYWINRQDIIIAWNNCTDHNLAHNKKSKKQA